jgi:Transposase/Transposase IS116/IS110/IS902 family
MLMAHARDAARSYGKSDPIDALAVARAALREPDLPTAQLDGPARDVRLLSDHREHLIDERTRVINRSVGICTNSTPATNRPPGHSGGPNTSPPSRLGWPSSTALSPDSPAPRSRTVDDSPSRSRPWMRNSRQPSNSLHRPCSTSAAAPRSPQPRSSARPPMSVASGQDTPSPDPTAPRPCRSGQATKPRHRLSRTGNRQLNAAIHRIAITQAHYHEPARLLLDRRREGGNNKAESFASTSADYQTSSSSPAIGRRARRKPCSSRRVVDIGASGRISAWTPTSPGETSDRSRRPSAPVALNAWQSSAVSRASAGGRPCSAANDSRAISVRILARSPGGTG